MSIRTTIEKISYTLVFILSLGDIFNFEENMRSRVLILHDVHAQIIVEQRPATTGRKMQTKMFGFPMKMNGKTITSIIFAKSCTDMSKMFDDLTTGVL